MNQAMYYVNSEGREIDLTKPPYIGEKSNDLLSYRWAYQTMGQAVQRIVKFEKVMVEKKFHVIVSGADEVEYYDNLEKFLQLTDIDINNNKMGKLYIGKYYLEGYIFANSKPKRYLGTNKTLIECEFVCERGNWQREETYNFHDAGGFDGEQQYTGNGILYPYNYPYDYSAPFGKNSILTEAYLDTDIEIIFYGATSTPKVTIGGNIYEFIDCPLGQNEYIVLNTQKKSAILYKVNGETENIFKKRNKEHYIYQKLKGGNNVVLLDNNMKVDITLFIERSEPKWGDKVWT